LSQVQIYNNIYELLGQIRQKSRTFRHPTVIEFNGLETIVSRVHNSLICISVSLV